jgi:hypothetical protein
MHRRKEVEGCGKVNELIWTETVVSVSPKRIVRKCRVVKVEDGEEIPRLADWSGSSDWFFYRNVKRDRDLPIKREDHGSRVQPFCGNLVHRDLFPPRDMLSQEDSNITYDSEFSTPAEPEPEQESPSRQITQKSPQQSTTISSVKEIDQNSPEKPISIPLNQLLESNSADLEPDDISEAKKLRGLDLFCGGGNFGRGVADGGAVVHKWFNNKLIVLIPGLSTSMLTRYTVIKRISSMRMSNSILDQSIILSLMSSLAVVVISLDQETSNSSLLDLHVKASPWQIHKAQRRLKVYIIPH